MFFVLKQQIIITKEEFSIPVFCRKLLFVKVNIDYLFQRVFFLLQSYTKTQLCVNNDQEKKDQKVCFSNQDRKTFSFVDGRNKSKARLSFPFKER